MELVFSFTAKPSKVPGWKTGYNLLEYTSLEDLARQMIGKPVTVSFSDVIIGQVLDAQGHPEEQEIKIHAEIFDDVSLGGIFNQEKGFELMEVTILPPKDGVMKREVRDENE